MVTVLTVVSAVLAGLITVLAVVAPLTKSTIDNKILDGARFIRDLVIRLIGGQVEPKLKA